MPKLAVLLIALTAIACGSPTAELPDRGIQGAEAGDGFWQDWTPRTPEALPVDDRLDEPTVFDAWRVEDETFRHQGWDALFHLLAAVNSAVDSPGFQSVVTRLESTLDTAQWEIAFVSHPEGAYEGIVVRMFGDDAAGLWLEGLRTSGDDDRPTRWNLRAEPAAEEADGLAVRLDRGDEGWEALVAHDADATPDEPLDTRVDLTPLVDGVTEAFWEEVTDQAYVDPDFQWRDAEDESGVEGWPAALGESVEERGLDDFAADTVFPPRTRDGDLEEFRGQP